MNVAPASAQAGNPGAFTEQSRVFRVYAGIALAMLLVICISPVARAPAAGEVPSTFTPEFTPVPSPTQIVTALPPPITRPEDARGIQQRTTPLQAPATFRPPAPPSAQWLTSDNSFTIPCSVHAQRVFVTAVVGGKERTFVLGSAARFTTIDTRTAAPSPDDPIVLPTFQIGELRFNGLEASVGAVNAFAQTYLGAPADGVLGQELFARFPVKIDYRACSVMVFRDSAAAQADAERLDAANRTSIALTMIGGLPTLQARMDSTNAVLALDTASDADVDLLQQFLLSTHIAFAGPAVPELRRAVPDGQLQGRTARAPTLSIGSLALDAPLVGIITATLRVPAGVAGFIGNGVLDRFTVLIDEPANTCVLMTQQGSSAAPSLGAQQQSYDRSGLWLVMRQNAIVVKSVLPGSPASRAAMRPGDLIVSVNGQTLTDLDAARALFAQPAGTTLSVTYLRGNAQHTVSLALRTLV